MIFRDLPGDVQPQARARLLAFQFRPQAFEAAEDPALLILRNPDSGVRHAQDDVSVEARWVDMRRRWFLSGQVEAAVAVKIPLPRRYTASAQIRKRHRQRRTARQR